MKRIFILLGALALLLAATGCGDKKRQTAVPPETVRGVAVLEVRASTVPDSLEAVGTVKAAQTSQLSSQVVATVTAIRAHEGQRVRRGEVLIVLDDTQPRARLESAVAAVNAAQQDIGAAEADYGLAHSTLQRYDDLYRTKSVSPHEMDEVSARYKAAAARREQASAGMVQAKALESQARAGLSYTRIVAPFDGYITEKHADPGALAAPGVPLMTIEDTRTFRLEASVDEGDIQHVKLGATVPVLLDALGTELRGKVVQIIPAADPASRSFIVKVELAADPRLRSGMFGRVRIARGERQTIMVPTTAVLDRGQLQAVYVLGDGQVANLRYVTLGKAAGDAVEVLSGLQPGERVVAQPADRELAGKRIEVQ